MKTKSILLTTFLLLITLWVGAFDASYYSAAKGKKGAALKTALAGIIYTTNSVGYNGLKSAYVKTDKRDDGYLYDIYSNVTNYVPGSSFVSGYSKEGDGYNREHTIPQSIFNEATPMKADLYHVYPCDGFLNGERGNNCHGEVGTSCTESANNFSKWGAPSSSLKSNGCDETEVFEPNDIYKGDIARTYFYFVTCYQSKLSSFGAYGMFDKSTYPSFTNWAKEMLLEWSKNDPVSTKETKRTEAVYNTSQHNRNPFIDYPGLEQYIWGTYMNVAFDPDNYQNPYDTPTPVTPSISLSQNSATVAEGASLTLTATTQNATGATVTWMSSNTSVATVTGGTVTALAEGTTVITAKITVSGTTYSATCYVTVTRNETPPVVEGDYVKVTSAPADWSGTYLIVCEDASVALNGALSSLDVVSNTISVSPTNNQITSTPTTEAAEFTIASRTSGGYSIMTKGGTYIGHSGSNNALKTSSSDDFENGISVSDGNVTITCNGKNLRFNPSSGQTRFRYFGSDQTAIQLYKKTESAPAVPSISLDQSDVTEEVGNTFTLTATTQNADGATVVWASSNPQVATVNDGLVRCVASGATSISATITVNGVSVAATCNVTVVDNSSSGGDGTLGNPYSVAEVLALFASNSVPTANVHVKGIISRITSLNTAMYTNARYYISDDGSETDEFYVYNGKYLEGADFTRDDQIQTGDEVVICGRLTTYGTTNEFAAGNYIVSLKRPSSLLLGDVNRDGNVTIADVTALVNIILGKATEGDSTNYDFKAADVNEDEDITIADVTALVNLILHKE